MHFFKPKILKFLTKNQTIRSWFYRGILIVILIALPFYGQLSFHRQPSEELNEFNQLYNSPEVEPVAVQLKIGENEDLLFLDETLQKIFPEGWDKLSDEAKAIEIEKFVVNYLKRQNNSGTATKILKDGYAICGGMAYVFRILNRRVGLPARYVGLFYTPDQGSHALTEIYYQNTWHLFDPTFGIFLYSNPTYNQKGHILSMAEIRANNQAGFAHQVVNQPWTGLYDATAKQFNPQPMKPNYLTQYSPNFNNYWREEIEHAFPVAYGATSWVSIPVDMDLQNANYKIIGKINQDYSDLAVLKRFSGQNYLGKSGDDMPGLYNTWLVYIDAPREVKIRYWSGQDFSNLKLIRLRSVQLLKTEKQKDHFDFYLRIIDNPGIFIIIAPQGSFVVDAIEVWKE